MDSLIYILEKKKKKQASKLFYTTLWKSHYIFIGWHTEQLVCSWHSHLFIFIFLCHFDNYYNSILFKFHLAIYLLIDGGLLSEIGETLKYKCRSRRNPIVFIKNWDIQGL